MPWCNIAEKFLCLGMANLGAATLLRSQHQKCIRQFASCIVHTSTAWHERVWAPIFALPCTCHVIPTVPPHREIIDARPHILADRAREAVNSNQQITLRLLALPSLRCEGLAFRQLGEHNANAPQVCRKAIITPQLNLWSPVRYRHGTWRHLDRILLIRCHPAPSKICDDNSDSVWTWTHQGVPRLDVSVKDVETVKMRQAAQNAFRNGRHQRPT